MASKAIVLRDVWVRIPPAVSRVGLVSATKGLLIEQFSLIPTATTRRRIPIGYQSSVPIRTPTRIRIADLAERSSAHNAQDRVYRVYRVPVAPKPPDVETF